MDTNLSISENDAFEIKTFADEPLGVHLEKKTPERNTVRVWESGTRAPSSPDSPRQIFVRALELRSFAGQKYLHAFFSCFFLRRDHKAPF